ncbi:MAG: efflux RND transporter permease subunit [Bacteroidota bacterium]
MDHPNQSSESGQWSAQVANWAIKWRWLVLGLSFIIAFGAGYGGQFLAFNDDYHVFFSEDNPQLLAFDALQNKYSKDDNVFIVIEPKNGEVFTRETLALVEELTDSAWQTPYSSRVDALTNFQHTSALEDDLYVEDLVENAMEKSDEELLRIKQIATKEPLLVHRLVDPEGSLTAINITVKLPGESIDEGVQISTYVRNMVDQFEAKHPEYNTYMSGMVMLSGAFREASEKDFGTLMPLMFLIIIITMLLATRSVSGTFATLLVIILSIMTAMGIAGWMGIKLTPPSASAITIIMTLAVADSVHVLISLIQKMREGFAEREAIVESLRLNLMPVFITSLTTVIGFMTLNFSEAPPFRDLGNITAIGMTAAFVFSILTLPALMAILPLKVTPKETIKRLTFMDRLGDFVVQNNKRLLWITSLVIIGFSALLVRNELNDEFVKYFDDGVQFRSDTDYISQKLTGIYTVEFSLGAGESGGINNPEYLASLNQFETWLNDQPEVIHVNSYVEISKRVNKSMHGDSLQYYRVPVEREEAAQFLLLYEMSLPFGLDLNNQINVDKSETRLIATVENMSSKEMIAFSERAENWLVDNSPTYMHTHGISPTLMFSHLGMRQINSMISSSILAILLISLVLMFALRSFKYGALSLIPNITPITVGFGVWALTYGQINTGVAIVFGMTLGIIVDDTVHFISKYLRAVREYGMSPQEAVKYAFSTVGKALIITTLVLVSGFVVLAQSQFGMNAGMARITVIIISLALVIDFLLVPALLLAINRDKGPEPSGQLSPSLAKS